MWDKHQIVEEPYDGKLSRTVLKPSRGSDAPAQVNYNRVSKQPVLAIETDGYTFHKSGTSQSERDIKKDHILELYEIPLVRLSTIGSNEKKIIEDKLSEILHLQ